MESNVNWDLIFSSVTTKWRPFFEKYKRDDCPLSFKDEHGINLLIAYFIYSESQDVKVVEHIINCQGFDVNHVDNEGRSALWWACA